jgi:hypothetical protein
VDGAGRLNQGLAEQYGLLSAPIARRGLKNSGVASGVLVFNRGVLFPVESNDARESTPRP